MASSSDPASSSNELGSFHTVPKMAREMATSSAWDVANQITEWERLGELGMEAGLLEFGFSAERVVHLRSLDQSEVINLETFDQLTEDERPAFLALVGRSSSSVKRLDLHDWTLSQTEAFALCVNLSSNMNIEKLNLVGNSVFGTADGCTLLGSAFTINAAVQELNLSAVNMDSQAVRCLLDLLQENKTLLYVDLSKNPLLEEGLKSVAEFLKINGSLQSLDISWTGLHEGEKFLSSALEVNTSLEELRFGGNGSGMYGLPKLLEPLSLYVSSNSAKNTTLKRLHLIRPHFSIDESALWNSIEKLAWMIRKNNTLTTLGLHEASISPEDWKEKIFPALKENGTLQELNLSFGEGLEEKDVQDVLIDLFRFSTMDESARTNISIEKLAWIIRMNNTLTTLGVHEASISPEDWKDKIFPALKENGTLQELDLSFCEGLNQKDVQDDLIDLLRFSSSGLTHIHLTGTSTRSLQEAVNEELTVNRDYRAKLRGQTTVQTLSGRLVLCGYEFAGKTAILKTMERIEHGTPFYHHFSDGWKKLRQTFPGLRQFLLGNDAYKRSTNRTRGFSVVGFNKQRYLKFVWDLAGQREYYALHDYLFPNINNSCFLYVCSCRSVPDAQHPNGVIKNREAMKNECEFWMKFIASNSKTIQTQDYLGRQLPSVRFVLTKKDTLDPNEMIISKQWAALVVREVRQAFKDVVDLCETVEFVNAHSSRAVKHLFTLTSDSLEGILAGQEEYAICEEVRKVFTRLSVENPVMSIDAFHNIREGRFHFANAPTPVKEAVSAYLNDIGEAISPRGFDFIADPRWFGVRVLGSLIDAFKGVEDQPKVSGCINGFQQGLQSWRLVHDHGYVDIKDIKNLLNNSLQTTHLQQTISSDQLVDLLIHLELCFKREPGNVDSPLFLPALFDDETETAARGERQLGWKLSQTGPLHYLGRRLECENKAITFLTPGFFPRLQVHLRNYIHEKKWIENSGFAVDRNLICFAENGIEVLVEYSGDIDYFVDVLVRSSEPHSEALKFIEEHVIKKILHFCASPQGCQGVTLVEAVIRPVCVRELHSCVKRKDHSVLVSTLKGRLEENKGYKHTWREHIGDVGDTDFALNLLEGEGSHRSSITSPDILWSTAAASATSPTNQFPRLFYPTLEDVGILRMLDVKLNPAKKIAIKLHLLCDHKDGFHQVENQPGRTIMLNWKAGGYDVHITKLAMTLLWAGVGVGAGITGANINLPQVDNWIQRLFNVPEMPDIDAETLHQMMNPGKTHARISEKEILEALARYWRIDPHTQGLKEILNLQDGGSFWHDFRLHKVVYSEAPIQGRVGWVCDGHYREGLQQQILLSAHH